MTRVASVFKSGLEQAFLSHIPPYMLDFFDNQTPMAFGECLIQANHTGVHQTCTDKFLTRFDTQCSYSKM